MRSVDQSRLPLLTRPQGLICPAADWRRDRNGQSEAFDRLTWTVANRPLCCKTGWAGALQRLAAMLDLSRELSRGMDMREQRLPKQDYRLDRRAFVALIPGAAFAFTGCATQPPPEPYRGPNLVTYVTHERPGTIVVDPANHFLHLVQKGDQALQY